jgi:photosystem II stability/assembly factor-like uncharacterized protein
VLFIAVAVSLLFADHPAVAAGGWTNNGPAGKTVLAIAATPGEPRVVYAGLATLGLFKSTDGGVSWRTTALNNGEVGLVVIDSTDPRTLYALITDELFKSTDAGASWERTGLDDNVVTSIAIDPVTATTLYAAAFDNGVYRSFDGGTTWEWAGSGLPTLDSFDLVIDPAATSVIYAGSDQDEGHGGVFVSSDRGESWALAGLQGLRVLDLEIDSANPSRLLAAVGPNNEGLGDPTPGGVFETLDGGESWHATGLQDVAVTSVAIDPNRSSTLYATVIDGSGRPDGVLKSTDGGVTWTPANAGLPNLDVFPAFLVVVARSVADTVYLSTDGGGAWKSTNGGVSWTSMSSDLPLTTPFGVKGLATAESLTAYAAVSGRGVFRTTDGGGTWEPTSTGLVDSEVDPLTVVVDPNRPTNVYAPTLSGVVKSEDSGATWTPFNQGLENTQTRSIAVDPTNSAILYALTTNGVFKTTDGGANWKPMNQGLGFFGDIAFAIAPDSTNVLYIHTSPGLYKSTDGSNTWQRLEDQAASTLVAQDRKTVFAASWGGGILGTSDGGVTWRQLLSDAFVTAVALSPSSGSIYAAGFGVWRSDDNGMTWSRIDEGIVEPYADALAVSTSSPPTIYAGTPAGVFVMTDSTSSSGGGDGCTMVPPTDLGGCAALLLGLAVLIFGAGFRSAAAHRRSAVAISARSVSTLFSKS